MHDDVSSEVSCRIKYTIGNGMKFQLLLRKKLHQMGFRFRLSGQNLPEIPYLLFPRYRAVIFVCECVRHNHTCYLSKLDFTSIDALGMCDFPNKKTDKLDKSRLIDMGWRIGVVWECSFEGKYSININEILELCAQWLKTDMPLIEIGGQC
jgi:DNA mismatch endonuclease (patch repair protein)